MINLDIIVPGGIKDVVALQEGEVCVCRAYIDALDEKTQKKLVAVMELMADKGMIKNIEKFRSLGGGIYEFKARYARVFCFFLDNYVVCTHGTDKPKKKQLQKEIKKAKALRLEYQTERR